MPPEPDAFPEPDETTDADASPEPRFALQPAADRSLVVPDPLRRYMAEIGRFALLDAEEEYALAVRFRDEGDRAAAYRLATSNLRLVVHIAMSFRRTAMNLLDLIQEGNMGLLQAVQRFDPYRKVRFSAYAGWWIRAYILKYIIDHWSLVRVGTTNTRRKLLFNLRKEKEALEAQGIKPEPRLLAERLGVPEQEVIEVEQGMGRDLSLDAPLGPESETPLSDRMVLPAPPVDEQLADEEFQTALRESMAAFAGTLDERDREIFDRRLVTDTPETLQQIGDRQGVSREAIRQREQKIIHRLKAFLRQELADFENLEFLRHAD
ncbi:MAG: sigma-70 family RNA polymerase sigma factor [Acidobacteriota bacterium]